MRRWSAIDMGLFHFHSGQTSSEEDGVITEQESYLDFQEYGANKWHKVKVDNLSYFMFRARSSKLFVFADHYMNPNKLVVVPYKQEPVLSLGIPKTIETIKSGAIRNILVNGEHILVEYLAGPFRNYRIFNGEGNLISLFNSPRSGSIKEFKHLDGQEFEFTFNSPIVPTLVVKHDFSSMAWKPAEIDLELLTDEHGIRYLYQYIFATSEDGTKIPVQTFRREDIRPSPSTPLYMQAYGGHGLVAYFIPNYSPGIHMFLSSGGIYATPAVRGGGEYGNRWYEQIFGTRVRYEDTASSLQELHRLKFGSPKTTAFEGWSSGGLLAGVMLTQYPELFKLVIPGNGIHDMVRKEVLEDDGRNAWVRDYGGHGSKEEVHFIESYSPFIYAQERKNYPTVYAMVGQHDQRVNPSHTFKLVAALQDSQQGTNPILMHHFNKSGHWPTKPGWVGRRGLEGEIAKWKVIFHELGMTLEPVQESFQGKR